MKKILLALCLSVPSLVFAQESLFTITPSLGYMAGGGMRVRDSQLSGSRYIGVDISRSNVFGLRVGRRLLSHPAYQIELGVLNQSSQFVDRNRLFGEEPSGPFPAGDINVVNVNVTHWDAGVLWNFRGTSTPTARAQGLLQPFATAAVGITHVSPSSPLPSTNAPSVSGGIGFDLWMTPTTALRFETRAHWVATDSGVRHTERITNRDCTGECTRVYRYPNGFGQVEAMIGFTWGFNRLPYLDDVVRRPASTGGGAENP
ncbi:MAG: hypothetical protein WBX15_10100 [Thermoanaerobaculia bacterium]